MQFTHREKFLAVLLSLSIAGYSALAYAQTRINLNQIQQQGTNTIVGNTTAGTANLTAITVGSCSSAASALKWTTNTGIGCNTAIDAATLGGKTFASPAAIGTGTPAAGTFTSITATGAAITPDQTTGIIGTTTNNNAQAGSIGEYVITSTGNPVALTSTIVANIVSIALTAGDWDVTANGFFTGGVTTTVSSGIFSITATSATNDYTNGRYSSYIGAGSTPFTYGDPSVAIPPVRFSLAAPATIYLVASANFAVSTAAAYGTISARRVR